MGVLRATIPALALATGGVAACIIPGDTFVVIEKGKTWCARVVGAEGVASGGADGQDDDGGEVMEEIRAEDGDWTSGCECFTLDEVAHIEARLAADDYDDPQLLVYVAKVGVNAQQACLDRSNALGLSDPTCTDAWDDVDIAADFFFTMPGKCSIEVAGDGTGGQGQAQLPDPATVVSCSGNTCSIDGDFVDDILDDPYMLLQDGTDIRATTTPVRGFEVRGVTTGSMTAAFGFQTGDVIDAIGGLPMEDIDDVVAAHAALEDDTSVRVGLRRWDGASWRVVSLTFNRI